MTTERSISPSLKAELKKTKLRPVLLLHTDFPSGEVCIWSGTGELSYGDKFFLGMGALMSIEAAAETVDTRANGAALNLNGLDATLLAKALQDDYQGSACQAWLALLDDKGAIIGKPVTIFKGILDSDEITDDGKTATLRITAENRMSDHLRPREYRYTHQDQQTLYPEVNDKGLEFIAALQDTKISWGK